MNFAPLRFYAPLVLRIGLAIVFFLFAYHKLNLLTVGQGRAEIEIIFGFPLAAAAAINYYVGLFELMLGIALLIGWKIKYAAPAAAGLVLVIFGSIVAHFGLNTQDSSLIKDIGLIGAGCALWLLGAGKYSIDGPAEPTKKTGYAGPVLRITLAAVLGILGLQTLQSIQVLGIAELVFAALLIAGLMTRYIALGAFAIAAFIWYTVLSTTANLPEGFSIWNDPTRFRDAGVLASALALAALGGGKWSLDNRKSG